MKKVLQPGRALSASQRRQLELQAKMRACTVSPLREQVEETLQVLAERKEQGVRDEPLNKVILRDKGTVSIAEWMGY